MKLTILGLAGLLLFVIPLSSGSVVAQGYSNECGMPVMNPPPPSQSPAVNFGGRFISSTGTLRVLMIWVRFADDNEATASWPNPAVLPDWAAHFVDTAYSPSGQYYPGAVSRYFYENSYNMFHVIGDVYYVATDSAESYFHRIAQQTDDHTARSAIETEVLNKLDAPPYNVDFRRYDNWAFAEFNHSNISDDTLDMCWFMTRNLHDSGLPQGQAPFGTGWARLDCMSLTKDGIFIKGYNYYLPGSGIGIFEAQAALPLNSSVATDDKYPNVNVIAHEMSHYLFGVGHFAQGDPFLSTDRAGGLMTPYAGGWRGHYSGYEKWRLGWLTPTVVTSNTDISLYELGSTMDLTKTKLIQVPISGSSQYYLVEYRGWTSPYEFRYTPWSAAPGRLKPGILIYLIVTEQDYLTFTSCFMQNADGMFRYGLSHDGGISCFQLDDVIQKLPSEPFRGYHETGDIFVDGRAVYCGSNRWESWYAS